VFVPQFAAKEGPEIGKTGGPLKGRITYGSPLEDFYFGE